MKVASSLQMYSALLLVSIFLLNALKITGAKVDENTGVSNAELSLEPSAEVVTKFWLYTKSLLPSGSTSSEQLTEESLKLKSTSFKGDRDTKVLIHGYQPLSIDANSIIQDGEGSGQWLEEMSNALLKRGDFNVIVVDWVMGASVLYTTAVANTVVVGAKVAQLIEIISNETGAKVDSFHLIGHSLGAHVAGFAGHRLGKRGRTLARITGLDPAGLAFEGWFRARSALHPSDARFVDVIHTTRLLGLEKPMGHVDFYPNGGKSQPGCVTAGIIDLQVCGHSRAHEYFTSSINPQCSWAAFPCTSAEGFHKGNCTQCGTGGCPTLGYDADKFETTAEGNYYLLTTGRKPFCGEHYVVRFHTKNGFFSGSWTTPHIELHGEKANSTTVLNLERRYFSAGSTQSFVVIVDQELGPLSSLSLWVTNSWLNKFDSWYAHKITVQHMGPYHDKYTACIKQPLGDGVTRTVSLNLGDQSC